MGTNTSGNFNDTNVNKKSLSLNVRSAKGLETVKRLIAISDMRLAAAYEDEEEAWLKLEPSAPSVSRVSIHYPPPPVIV